MRNVALLGGGLDPISIHHEVMVDETEANADMPTWVMPCYGHLFAKGSRLTDSNHRWAMVEETAKQRQDDIFVPFKWEIEHRHSGSMYETISHLKQECPDVLFHIVIGMDNANVIETKWDRGNILIQENPFIVFEREGVYKTADWFLQSPHKVIPLRYDVSSTVIREAIQKGEYSFAERNLNPAVWDYIRTNNLYGYKA
jgi:nicotinate (nicotinamide) nucleotide adenylyltransferase